MYIIISTLCEPNTQYNYAILICSHSFAGDLHVVIESTSNSTDHPVGSSLQLTCRVQGGEVQPVGSLSYSWMSTCSGECFVSGQTTPSISRDVLRAADTGTHTCAITDSVGNYGSASFNVEVTGESGYLCPHMCTHIIREWLLTNVRSS